MSCPGMTGPVARATPTIRPASADDAEAIAAVLTVALVDKYRPALGRRAADAVAGAVRAEAGAAGVGYFVAEHDGAVVGAAHLALDEGSGAGLVSGMAAVVGWPRALRAAAVLALVGEGPRAADVGYIDELAVAGGARRRGAGRSLLAACEECARAAGKRRLTLWVTSDNHGALALYRGAGFRAARRRRWLIRRLLFRAPGALYMEKTISPG